MLLPLSAAVFLLFDLGLPRARVPSGAWQVLGLAAVLTSSDGCSLSLDTSGSQCTRSQDCARFQGAVCDPATRLCVRAQSTPTGAAGVGGLAAGRGSGGSPGAAAADSGSNSGVATSASGSGRGCRFAAGCTPCSPPPQLELLNGCSDVICVAFDNRRLTNLGPDGGLAPLP